MDNNPRHTISRRSLMKAGALAPAGVGAVSQQVAARSTGSDLATEGRFAPHATIQLSINGVVYGLEVDARVTLLDLLRERLQLTGAKKGCNRGECGACTVLLDGRRVNACLVLAGTLDGRQVTTVEGLMRDGRLHPVQQAFIDHDAFQCGFCTSGQIMSAVGCIAEGHTKSNGEIREWMSGNLCRCSAYPQIAAAVHAAAQEAG